MKKYYIVGPYRGTSKNPLINYLQRQRNIHHAERVAQRLWAEGSFAFCPHMNSANFDNFCPESQFLIGYLCHLRTGGFDGIYLLKGWQKSFGSLEEKRLAEEMHLEIRYEEGDEWE